MISSRKDLRHSFENESQILEHVRLNYLHVVDFTDHPLFSLKRPYRELISRRDELEGWLEEQCGEKDGVCVKETEEHFSYSLRHDAGWAMLFRVWYFRDPELAVAFKLRWY